MTSAALEKGRGHREGKTFFPRTPVAATRGAVALDIDSICNFDERTKDLESDVNKMKDNGERLVALYDILVGEPNDSCRGEILNKFKEKYPNVVFILEAEFSEKANGQEAIFEEVRKLDENIPEEANKQQDLISLGGVLLAHQGNLKKAS